ncbi:CaiB/BaiF CoA transferase family protein [Sandaracinobacteroides saxicola]|uniref:CoA transferase n=1 Tax=Sandaracinobacteroides saxicola TaxID=2759707 RepID=A0A7G5ILB8_9SPHN|nr:CoA transferase [Sandaracinobacteroides saxicola]QMW24160.1 CoA transferase [Sandaracinobacteroides saxicola]
MPKLTGLRVLDLSQFLPGPALTLMLADHGAEVIKIEPPTGDPARTMAPFEAGHGFWFRNLNRGKQSLPLDLKTPEGKARLTALIATADVFVEGFRPGVIARLGFDYDTVSALNPAIIYCSISAFGQTGSMAHHPAHDMGAQALAGFLSVNDGPDGTPVVPGVPAADMAAGLTGAIAVLMALHARHTSGRGDYIDLAMFDSLLPWCAHIAGPALTDGIAPTSATGRSLGGHPFYNIYRTSDSRHITLCGREPKFSTNLLTALARPDLIPLAHSEAGPHHAPLTAFLTETFLERTRDQWTAWFHHHDVAYAPVLDFREALTQPLIAERGLVVHADGGHHLAPAIRFTGEPAWQPAEAPILS